MKNKKGILGKILTAFVALCAAFMLHPFAQTYQDVTDEMTNAKKESVYDTKLNAPFGKDTSGVRESVNIETGAVTVSCNLFELTNLGGGSKESIVLEYCNNGASEKEETVVYEKALNGYINGTRSREGIDAVMNSFGIGWHLNLAYVEIPDEYNKTEVYVHLPGGSVYLSGSTESGLKDYELQDLKFTVEKDIVGNVIGYTIEYSNGDVYKFGADGYPESKTNRYGCITEYEWSSQTPKTLNRISNNRGDSVEFSYSGETITVGYKGREYKILRKKSGESYLVTGIVNPQNEKTTFEYEKRDLWFDFYKKSDITLTNSYYVLSKISYAGGLKTLYSYATFRKWLNEKTEGSIEYTKLIKRVDQNGKDEVSMIEYRYSGEPSGYPQYKSDALPSDYVYSTFETKAGITTQYVYNNEHNQTEKSETVNGETVSEEKREYNKESRMPERFITATYDGEKNKRTVTELTSYDSLGNLIRSEKFGTAAERGEDITEYKYDSRNNICIYESSFKDKNTKIEIKRTLSENGASYASEAVYENGNLVKKDEYEYNNAGYLVKEKLQTDKAEFLEMEYKYSGKMPIEIKTSGIKTADDEYISNTVKYEYDLFSNLIKTTVQSGSSVKYEYDNCDRKIKETLEDGKSRTWKYNIKENTIETQDANGKKLLYFYDKCGKLKEVMNNETGITLKKLQYDKNERLVSESDANGNTIKYTYDELGRYKSITLLGSDGTVHSEKNISYSNDAETGCCIMRVTEGDITEPRTVVYRFNRKDYLTEKIYEGEGESRSYAYEYDIAGNMTGVIYPNGTKESYAYNVFGNRIEAEYADGSGERFEYDYIGNQTMFENGEGEREYVYYDGLGRKLRTEIPNGEKRSIYRSYYDERGNVVCEIDAEGGRKEHTYNERGYLESSREYSDNQSGTETEYERDGEGNIISISYGGIGEGRRITRKFERDENGNVTKETNGSGESAYYEYDGAGNLITKTDMEGNITRYSYDAAGNVKTEETGGIGKTEYEYNSHGEETQRSRGGVTKETGYNVFGEKIYELSGKSIAEYKYNEMGQVAEKKITDRDIGEIKTGYEYDKRGRTSAIITQMGREEIEYDKAGRIIGKRNSQTGEEKRYAYYPSGKVKSVVIKKEGEIVYTENNEYNQNGSKTQEEINGEVRKYKYDGMGRLKSTQRQNGDMTEYEFDGFGNIAKEYTVNALGIGLKQYHYTKDGRLSLSESESETVSYSYNKNGSLKEKTVYGSGAPQTYNYSYDGNNRLREYVSEKDVVSYEYNLSGLRESKTRNGERTRYIYDEGSVVGEEKEGDYYIYHRATELIGYESYSGSEGYYRQNSHGSVVSVTDSFGEEKRNYTYSDYGKKEAFRLKPMGEETTVYVWKAETDGVYNPFGYCGEYLDEETGFIYLRNRYYDPSIGRFISEDPIKYGTNWYIYCNNNPIKYIDPSGLTYVIGWSYGTKDVREYEQYRLDNGYSVTVDGNTSDWDNATWSDFTQRSSFARAAYTKKQELLDMGVAESDIDVQRIDSEADLQATWNMWAGYGLIEGLDFYSHGYSEGAEVYGGSGDFWDSAQKLNFGESLRQIDGKGVILQPYAVFYGCNTANGSFAQNFSNTQAVTVYAQTDYASFSHTRTNRTWITTHATSKNVYLLSFESWGGLRNNDGLGKVFRPNN